MDALLHGKSVLQHTLDSVQASGLPWHVERAPHAGMGDAIAAAVAATSDAGGWLILPGDLPLIQASTLQTVAHALLSHAVVVPQFKGQTGHPVGFSVACRSALLNLHGAQGAAAIVKAHAGVKLDIGDQGIVTDIDTIDDLQRVADLLLTLVSP